jgi:hypothetical protein
MCVFYFILLCLRLFSSLRGRGQREVGALRIASFGIAHFGIASFGIASFEIASFEIASFGTKGSNCFLCGRLASFEYIIL